MGFFDFLKKPKEEEAKPVVDEKPVEVGIDSLEKKISEHVSGTLSREKGRAKDLYGKIRQDFREIRRVNTELSRKKFEEGERMYSAVNMIKNNYVNRTFGLLGGVPVIDGTGHEELGNFLSKTTKVLDGMRKVPPKQAILLSKYFKKEASEIVKILKRIEDSLEEMKGLLADGKTIPLVSKINSRVETIRAIVRKFRDLEQQEKILEEKAEKARKERKGKEEELGKLLKSEGYKRLVSSGKKAREMREEREAIENEIREEFSSLKRPLKKYEHILRNDRLIPREKRISLERLIHSPTKAVLDEGGESVLSEMTSRISESIERKEISLKESEEKRFREFSERVSEGRISEIRKSHGELSRKIEESEKQKDRESVLGDRERIRREIENLEHEISECGRNLQNIAKGKKSTKSEILGEGEKLEKTIETELGRKFVIKMF
jgi:hypothetical protein